MNFGRKLRDFEEKLQANMKDVMCPTHLCIGQEAVPTALHSCIQPEDWLFSTHRAHGHYMAKGGDMQRLWDEIMGKETGLNGGFAGSQSFSDETINFHCSAIVGGLVGVAVGAALALRLNRSKAIVVCCIGDAGTEQGVFWEALNFSVLHKLPIAFICENNGKSVDSHIWERQAIPVKERVMAFGVRVTKSVQAAVGAARHRVPSFYEEKCTLLCDHLNMSVMMPTVDYA